MALRGTEDAKIECAKRFFEGINKQVANNAVEYDVADSYERVMDIVGRK